MDNYIIRRMAKKALKPQLPIALVIALVAMLPNLIVSAVGIITRYAPTMYLSAMLNDSHSALNAAIQSGTVGDLLDELERYAMNEGLIYAGVNVLAWLITPAFALGLLNALQQLLRGREITTGMAFSRLPIWYKAIGLSALVAVKVALWGLPGMALVVGGSFLMLQENMLSIGMGISYAGALLSTVLTIRANYSYVLGTYMLAEKPEEGVMNCLRTSRQYMNGRRLQLFSLEVTFMLWVWASTMLGSMIGGVIGSTVSMILQLLVQVYQKTSVSIFYLLLTGRGADMKDTEAYTAHSDDPQA